MSGINQRRVFTHSRTLFLDGQMKPMKFYLGPCVHRADIIPIIEHGGGVISNTETKDTIRLVTRDSGRRTLTVSTDFIFKCVDENKLQDMDQFNVEVAAKSDEDLPKKKVKLVPRSNKRQTYTDKEKEKILDYVCQNDGHSYIGGTSLWKQMEEEKVVRKRTWQSIKEHFRKQIMPNLHRFQISQLDKDKLKKSEEKKKKRNNSPPRRRYRSQKNGADSSPDFIRETPSPELFPQEDRLEAAATVSDGTANVKAESVVNAMETDPGIKAEQVKSVTGDRSSEPDAGKSDENVERDEEPDVIVLEEIKRFRPVSRKKFNQRFTSTKKEVVGEESLRNNA